MRRRFRGLHARAFVHATEVRERVEQALRNVVGEGPITSTETEGVHGNAITILEVGVPEMFSRLSEDDLRTLLHTLDSRIDEGCNLFIKLDKQSAFLGEARLGKGDDVVSIRIRVAAFPAHQEVAVGVVREALEEELAGRAGPGPPGR
jgi:RNA binding exosome subunit